ncbi:hypothetical protein DLM45_14935 [Hyphomicrobium methylovorum]|nr:hypothetical protein [Hyphomicrobium methylovorum]
MPRTQLAPEAIGCEDLANWQYPAITEKAALDVHFDRLVPGAVEACSGPRGYFGAPWATFIDAGGISESQRLEIKRRLSEYIGRIAYATRAEQTTVEIHTVCQHIYWPRLLQFWREIGVTDLHVSHLEPDAILSDVRLHSWHLAAANVVNADRREGLLLNKPPATKKYLASFIGAHMDHYRSDVRLRVRDEVLRDGFSDVVCELTGDWHFNRVVYQQQIDGIPLSVRGAAAERVATKHYNEVLSESVFALCPEGAGPNTIRLWEALAIGAIPVVIVEDWVWPTIPGENLKWDDAVIHVRRNELDGLFDDLRGLRRFEAKRVESMQRAGMEVYRRFQNKRCF